MGLGLLVSELLDVAVLVLVAERGEALFALGRPGFAVGFCGELGCFALFLGDFLVLDVFGGLDGRSS